jgi:hypothetical protein
MMITRYSSSQFIATRIRVFVITNSLLSFGFVFALTIILGYFLSKRMSKV